MTSVGPVTASTFSRVLPTSTPKKESSSASGLSGVVNTVLGFLFSSPVAGCGFVNWGTPPGEHDADAGEPDADGIDGDIEIPDGDVIDGEDVVDGADVVDGDGDTIPDGEDIEVSDDGGPDGEVPSVCDHAPSAFVLESPTHSATGVSVQPLLNWQDSTDLDSGDQVKYRVQVDDNDDFSSPVIDRADLTESQYQVSASEALNFDTLYFWKVIAYDGCPTEVPSAVFQFRTARPEVCNNSPTAFTLESPADNETGVSTTPTFNWSNSTDPDTGDTVTYRLIVSPNPDLSSPVLDKSGLTASEYTVLPTEALTQGVTYYWKVEAYDSCGNVTESGVRSFTTILCTPHTYFDTDFTSGTTSNTVVNSGTVSLAQDQSVWVCWDGSVYPETVGWTENAPVGWVTKNISGGVLELNTIDSNQPGYYEKNPSFNSSTGWMIEARVRTVDNQGGNGCVIYAQDDGYRIEFRLLNDRIYVNCAPGPFYLMDPRVDYNTYLITGKDGNYEVYVNGIRRVSGPLCSSPGPTSYIQFHDVGGTFDGHAYWDYLCYYNGGSTLPYVSNGTYTSVVIDTNNINNNIGSGAVLRWSQNVPAGANNIEMQVCASNDPGMAGEVCASGLTNNAGETIPPTVTGRYVRYQARLSTTLNLVTPELQDVTLTYETCE